MVINNNSNDTLILGSLHLKSKYILAPMEGVSDVGFRKLCYTQGAGLTWTEMVRASGIVRRNKATLDLIDTYDKDTPTGIQLFIVNEKELLAALNTLDSLAASTHPHFNNIIAVDLNFGCPSPDVIQVGAGPALIKRATKMETIFRTLHEWKLRTKLPIGAVGAKIRLGMNAQEQEYKVYLRVVPAANKYLDYIVVHARHAKQKSNDPVTWSAIAELKAQSTIPVIGNGDVFSIQDANSMSLTTNCDGIMIARGAIKNPSIFRELTNKKNLQITNHQITKDEIKNISDEYFTIARKYNTKPKYLAFHEDNFRKMLN